MVDFARVSTPLTVSLMAATDPVTSERLHAAKECKASSVINKFKDLEKRAANGEDDYGRDYSWCFIFLQLKLILMTF